MKLICIINHTVTDDPQKLGYFAGIIASSYYLSQLFSSFFWGYLSDKLGKPPITPINLQQAIENHLTKARLYVTQCIFEELYKEHVVRNSLRNNLVVIPKHVRVENVEGIFKHHCDMNLENHNNRSDDNTSYTDLNEGENKSTLLEMESLRLFNNTNAMNLFTREVYLNYFLLPSAFSYEIENIYNGDLLETYNSNYYWKVFINFDNIAIN